MSVGVVPGVGNFYPGALSNLYGIDEAHVVQSFCCSAVRVRNNVTGFYCSLYF